MQLNTEERLSNGERGTSSELVEFSLVMFAWLCLAYKDLYGDGFLMSTVQVSMINS